LSFWVRSSLTGTFGGVLRNSAENRSYPYTYTISSANTWEQKSVTIAGDTSGTWLTTNGVGIYVGFGLGVGTTYSGTAGAWAGSTFASATGATSVVSTNGATWYITGVMLEVGTQATTFTTAGGSYGAELALCQRYFQKYISTSTASAWQLDQAGVTGSYPSILLPYAVSMRTIPTATIIGSITYGNCTFQDLTPMVNGALFATSSGVSSGRVYAVAANTGNGHSFSAEL
jgi:hypothetical protein